MVEWGCDICGHVHRNQEAGLLPKGWVEVLLTWSGGWEEKLASKQADDDDGLFGCHLKKTHICEECVELHSWDRLALNFRFPKGLIDINASYTNADESEAETAS